MLASFSTRSARDSLRLNTRSPQSIVFHIFERQKIAKDRLGCAPVSNLGRGVHDRAFAEKIITVPANVENLNSLSQASLSEAFHLSPQNLLVDL